MAELDYTALLFIDDTIYDPLDGLMFVYRPMEVEGDC